MESFPHWPHLLTVWLQAQPHPFEYIPAWIQAATSLVAVAALAWTVWQFVISGFAVRTRAYIDESNKKIRLDIFNWGRIAGTVTQCQVVEKAKLLEQIFSKLSRQNHPEEFEDVSFVEFQNCNHSFEKTKLEPADSMRLTIKRKENKKFATGDNIMSRFLNRRRVRVRLEAGPGYRKVLKLRQSPGFFTDTDGWLPGDEAGHKTQAPLNAQANEIVIGTLATLDALRRSKLITQAEFDERKAIILRKIDQSLE